MRRIVQCWTIRSFESMNPVILLLFLFFFNIYRSNLIFFLHIAAEKLSILKSVKIVYNVFIDSKECSKASNWLPICIVQQQHQQKHQAYRHTNWGCVNENGREREIGGEIHTRKNETDEKLPHVKHESYWFRSLCILLICMLNISIRRVPGRFHRHRISRRKSLRLKYWWWW